MKKLVIGALATLSAVLLLPALASATPAHVSPAPEVPFAISAGHSELTRVAGGGMTSTATTGSGFFENTTTGRMNLTFHGLTSSIGTKCQSAGQPPGTVTTTELPFHLIMLGTSPGILVTSNEGHFATFSCGIFIPTVHTQGSGVLGTITSPECGKKANTASLSFQGTAGVQQHLTWTGTEYTRETSLGLGFSPSAISAAPTITFAGGATPTLICT